MFIDPQTLLHQISAWRKQFKHLQYISHNTNALIISEKDIKTNDLIFWDIHHEGHRLETLRYSIRLTQIRSIEIFITQTQTWDSEIFSICDTDLRLWECTCNTDLWLWDILHGWHSTGDLRFSPNGDTDPKDWDI